MGVHNSTRSVKYHDHGTRGRWYRTTELFDPHSNPLPEEDANMLYYEAYITQCEKHLSDAFHMKVNSEFQSLCEMPNEDMAGRVLNIKHHVAKYQHDVVSLAVDIIDGFTAEVMEPVQVLDNVGKAYVKDGFFVFVWDQPTGAKFGRCELKACRHLMELQSPTIHVPMTYHLSYKGIGATLQALVPINRSTTQITDARNDGELNAILREITASFNLKSYEEHGRSYFCPPDTQQHVGLDGRLYFIGNYQWLPAWPHPVRGRGHTALCRFSPIRLELLADAKPFPLRAFHRSAFVAENVEGLDYVKEVMDDKIHKLVMEESPVERDIVKRFRKAGFNYNLLGLLMLSVLRNVNPAPSDVISIMNELIARGIKHYVLKKVATTSRSSDHRGQGDDRATHTVSGGGGGGHQGGGDETSNNGGDSIAAFNLTASGSFGGSMHFGPSNPLLLGSPTSPGGRLRRSASFGDDFRDPEGSGMLPALSRGGGGGKKGVDLMDFDGDAGGITGIANHDDSTVAFIDVAMEALESFIRYEGAPMPREENARGPEVMPPVGTYGGEIIPLLYEKNRLVPQDLDLYRRIEPAQKHTIYQRACEFLGIVIENGELTRVLPILQPAGVAQFPVAHFVQRRLDHLNIQLLVRQATRQDWSRFGPGLALMAPQERKYWDDLDFIYDQVKTQFPPHIGWHALSNNFVRQSLEFAIRTRQHHGEKELIQAQQSIAKSQSVASPGGSNPFGSPMSFVQPNSMSYRSPGETSPTAGESTLTGSSMLGVGSSTGEKRSSSLSPQSSSRTRTPTIGSSMLAASSASKWKGLRAGGSSGTPGGDVGGISGLRNAEDFIPTSRSRRPVSASTNRPASSQGNDEEDLPMVNPLAFASDTSRMTTHSILERSVLVQLLRKIAHAAVEEEDWDDARRNLEEALKHAFVILKTQGVQSAPLYRLLVAEFINVYSQGFGYTSLAIETEMVTTFTKYCEPDTMLALDYIQLGAIETKRGFLSIAEQSFLRGQRILTLTMGEKHPLFYRCAVNLASLMCKRGKIREAFDSVQLLVEEPSAPPDVHEVHAQLLYMLSSSEDMDLELVIACEMKATVSREKCATAEADFMDSHAMIPLLFMARQAH